MIHGFYKISIIIILQNNKQNLRKDNNSVKQQKNIIIVFYSLEGTMYLLLVVTNLETDMIYITQGEFQ